MQYKEFEIKKVAKAIWEIPRKGNMRVPVRFYALQSMLPQIIKDNALSQAVNVASLPGIQKYSMAMPDIHYGYGFPIGGVAAFDCETGIISPGGVGYDINCGVRFCQTNLFYKDIKDKIQNIVNGFYDCVPSGVGSHDAIKRLNQNEEEQVMIKGTKWAIEQGYGEISDLDATESFGRMKEANPDKVSQRARSRGLNQVGTLGSGNHFLEIGIIDEVYDQKLANEFSLEKDQVVVMVHSGSRGFGYQICDDYLHLMVRELNNLPFSIPDRQLACTPFKSKLGSDYFQAMSCAANYAWANRQVLMSLGEKSLRKTLSISKSDLGFKLIYDVCHNIAKVEKHKVNGNEMLLCVHRKGATRSFGPNQPELAKKYQRIGQPVIVPGDMGTNSYLMIGTNRAMKETFGSCCHGAGRVMSRREAKRRYNFNQVKNKLKSNGIVVYSAQRNTLVEECSDTYKDVNEVVEAVALAGLAKKIVRTRPLGVLKG
ncbi:MAG: RtcB family protein [Candidatus Cloacimonetes bacterium]|nr:RtcB family protein [Candidatus Cloacimonadota bacterium]MBL7086863.1 RtcB family protein [Candidatus Cloacimonadota bacterium]